jgi:hypothetical protein
MHGGNGRSGAPEGNKNAKKQTSIEMWLRLRAKYGRPTRDMSGLDFSDPAVWLAEVSAMSMEHNLYRSLSDDAEIAAVLASERRRFEDTERRGAEG